MIASLRSSPIWVRVMAISTASVWCFHGLFSKVLQGLPRHRLIVARVLGDAWGGPATYAIGACEVLMAAWILSGRYPRSCAAAQTLALATMNFLEIRYARDLLLAPWSMVAANSVFLGLGWFLALARSRGEAADPV